ncbi:MAG: S8 family serine peptidase [Bacteroidetes bacterium]|nr:S8 family serine peptidase [Bacteroidota bacterium]
MRKSNLLIKYFKDIVMKIQFKTHIAMAIARLTLFAMLSVSLSASAQVTVRDGMVLADYLTVKFKIPVVEMPIGQNRATASDFKSSMQHIRSFFTRFGTDVVFEKVIEHARAEDTLYVTPSGEVKRLHDWSQVFKVVFPQPVDVWKTIKELQKLTEVEYAQPPIQVVSDLTPNDLHLAGNQWYLPKIRAEQAWDITTGSASIRIALIERGVAPHNDLANKLVAGETGSTGDHGVMVAGVAGAATNNNLGIASLGWNVLLVPMNRTNETGVDADTRNAANPGGVHRANIINCSFKTVTTLPDGRTQSYNYPSMQYAVEDAQAWGALVVASAGNPPPSNDADVVPYTQWPAAYSGVIAVSATNSADQFPSGYNYGNHVDVSGPAIDIQTLYLNNSYIRMDGTSFSAPLTSAIAALIWSVNSNLTATQVANIITSSADDLGPAGWDVHFGYGRINAFRAAAQAAPPSSPASPHPAP